MTENKRFDMYMEFLHIEIGITDKGKELTGNDVVTLLNQLINENEELKKLRNIDQSYIEELNDLYARNLEHIIEENKELKYDKMLAELDKRIDVKFKVLKKDIKELRSCINPYPVKEAGIKRG